MALKTSRPMSVTGLTRTIANLNTQMLAIPKVTKAGLVQSGLLIQREAQLNCPIDMGNLRASAYTVWSNTGKMSNPRFKDDTTSDVDTARMKMDHTLAVAEQGMEAMGKTKVSVGFSAYYALYVHENLEARHSNGTAKFLEKAVLDNTHKILTITSATVRKATSKPMRT